MELLYNQIAGTNFMVAYADSDGVVLIPFRIMISRLAKVGRPLFPVLSGWKATEEQTRWVLQFTTAGQPLYPGAIISFTGLVTCHVSPRQFLTMTEILSALSMRHRTPKPVTITHSTGQISVPKY